MSITNVFNNELIIMITTAITGLPKVVAVTETVAHRLKTNNTENYRCQRKAVSAKAGIHDLQSFESGESSRWRLTEKLRQLARLS